MSVFIGASLPGMRRHVPGSIRGRSRKYSAVTGGVTHHLHGDVISYEESLECEAFYRDRTKFGLRGRHE